jgi:hypothetical protein
MGAPGGSLWLPSASGWACSSCARRPAHRLLSRSCSRRGVMVALVPEGLPATLPVSLAIGVRRIAQRAALIRSWLPWRRWDRGPTPPGLPAPHLPSSSRSLLAQAAAQYGFQVSRIPAKAIQACGAASLPSALRNRSAGWPSPAPGAAGWCCTAAVRHRPRPARRAGQRTAPRRPAADHPRHGAAVPGRSQAPPQLAFPARIGAGRSRPACPALGTRAAPRLPDGHSTSNAAVVLPGPKPRPVIGAGRGFSLPHLHSAGR